MASVHPWHDAFALIQLEVNPRLCRGNHNGSTVTAVEICFPPPFRGRARVGVQCRCACPCSRIAPPPPPPPPTPGGGGGGCGSRRRGGAAPLAPPRVRHA